jgi:hypothetical protein
MTDQANQNGTPVQNPGTEAGESNGAAKAQLALSFPPPGLVAIALYLLLLAGTIIVGVVSGGHYPPVFLVFSALFMAASAGLFLLFRWAWAMALAAAVLLVGYNLWVFTSGHYLAALVQSLLNLIFFLYLVRPEVREKLR